MITLESELVWAKRSGFAVASRVGCQPISNIMSSLYHFPISLGCKDQLSPCLLGISKCQPRVTRRPHVHVDLANSHFCLNKLKNFWR